MPLILAAQPRRAEAKHGGMQDCQSGARVWNRFATYGALVVEPSQMKLGDSGSQTGLSPSQTAESLQVGLHRARAATTRVLRYLFGFGTVWGLFKHSRGDIFAPTGKPARHNLLASLVPKA